MSPPRQLDSLDRAMREAHRTGCVVVMVRVRGSFTLYPRIVADPRRPHSTASSGRQPPIDDP